MNEADEFHYHMDAGRRWCATVTYRTDAGLLEVEHDLNELADLDDLVERGPHFDTIMEIRIVRGEHVTSEDLTVEQAENI